MRFPGAYLSGGFKGFSASSKGNVLGLQGLMFGGFRGFTGLLGFRGLQGFRAHVLERVSLGES